MQAADTAFFFSEHALFVDRNNAVCIVCTAGNRPAGAIQRAQHANGKCTPRVQWAQSVDRTNAVCTVCTAGIKAICT